MIVVTLSIIFHFELDAEVRNGIVKIKMYSTALPAHGIIQNQHKFVFF